MENRVGFMHGRSCEPVEGQIQAFPWNAEENEFSLAASIDMHLPEWTLDQDRLYENPLMMPEG
jgi:L-ribulose-5-phosphate 3-epimerase